MRRTAVLLALVVALGFSQDWIARYSTGQYHDDAGLGIAVDNSGNSYVVGYADPKAIIVIKFSPQGDSLWTRTKHLSECSYFGGMGTAIGHDGNLFVAGFVRSGTQNGYRVLLYRPDGTCLTDTAYWIVNAGGVFPSFIWYSQCVSNDGSGGFYTAVTAPSESTSFDVVTSRFAQDGTLRWTRAFDGQRHDADGAYALTSDANGNALVAGGTTDASNHGDAVVLKYDSTGALLWSYAHRANTNYGSQARGIASDVSGIYVGGTGSDGSLVFRLSLGGDSVWSRADDSSEIRSVVVDANGNAVCAGFRKLSGFGRRTMRTWSYSPFGQLAWRQDYRGIDTMQTLGYFGTTVTGQEIYVSGFRLPGLNRQDYLVAKYGSDGTKLWSAFGGDSSDTHSEIPSAVAIDRDGNIILTGTSKHIDGTEEILTMKFRASGAVEEQPATPVEPQHVILASPSIVPSRCWFSVPAGERQSALSIADITGRTVREIPVPAGRTGERVTVTWHAQDEQGRPVPNGVYFVREQPPSLKLQAPSLLQAHCPAVVR